ncbi:hypothetical protein SUGI_0844300 [Cryptomeria japonica]|nr:hypothetical protein SUGI_0844300 [Cryptomeria japonica]
MGITVHTPTCVGVSLEAHAVFPVGNLGPKGKLYRSLATINWFLDKITESRIGNSGAGTGVDLLSAFMKVMTEDGDRFTQMKSCGKSRLISFWPDENSHLWPSLGSSGCCSATPMSKTASWRRFGPSCRKYFRVVYKRFKDQMVA